MLQIGRRWVGAIATLAVLGGVACRDRNVTGPTPERPVAGRSSPATRPSALSAAEQPLPPFIAGDAERGKQLVAQFECNRCHDGTGLSAPTLDKDCVRCHEQIATDRFKAPAHKLAKWKSHVMPYRDVPSLTAIRGRLRPEWVMDYLLNPRDLRPHLVQTMPRLRLSPEQARDITSFLTQPASDAPERRGAPEQATLSVTASPSQIAHGKQLMTERGCLGCHEYGGSGLSAPKPAEPSRSLALAPDLRFARQRAEPQALARWLLEPSQVKPDSAMPNLGLRPEEARDLAAFLAFGELQRTSTAAPPARLPVLARRVGFDEVNERVFAVTCRHCHTNPDLADGDGGPGNTGGFGFPARKIDFSSYQGIQSGGVDKEGNRVSLFAPTSAGVPRLVAALLARGREGVGQVSDEVRGMPLGLPPLAPEQIQLVESWVEQGRPL